MKQKVVTFQNDSMKYGFYYEYEHYICVWHRMTVLSKVNVLENTKTIHFSIYRGSC